MSEKEINLSFFGVRFFFLFLPFFFVEVVGQVVFFVVVFRQAGNLNPNKKKIIN